MSFKRTWAGKIASSFVDDLGERLTEAVDERRYAPRPYIAQDPIRDAFVEASSSYSGADCVVIAQVNEKLITLGNVLTVSYSIFREKSPVRTLGRSHTKGYTAGPRTIAGSMIFVVFDRNPLYEILSTLNYQDGPPQDRYSTPVADQIPPIDLVLWFSNEYGHKSVLRLYGVEFLQEGQTHSINDLYTENVMQYVARDMDVLINYKDIESFRNLLYERQISGQFTDNYLQSMLSYKAKIEKQIQDADNEISRIRNERGKRNMVTFGIWGTVSNDLKREYEKQLIVKASLLTELERINASIINYQKSNLFGFTRGDNSEATAARDDLRQENVTTVPYDKVSPLH